jgi:hypothetical protein
MVPKNTGQAQTITTEGECQRKTVVIEGIKLVPPLGYKNFGRVS